MKKTIQFPCGICGKECVNVESLKDAQFEDFSAGCDMCQLWFHYMCVGLKGNEPELQEGSNLEYYCPKCQTSRRKSVHDKLKRSTHKTSCSSITDQMSNVQDVGSSNAECEAENTCVQSTRIRKPVNRMDY